MKYCPNCGNQLNEDEKVCPKCGTNIEGETNETVKATSTNGRPTVQERNIVTCVILSLVTCGIYGLIWFINMANDVNTVCQDDKSSQSGGMVLLLTIVTCGIYGWIWIYQVGKRLAEAGQKHGVQIADNSVMYLVLDLFGLGIVDYCLIQSDLNKFAK